MKTRRKPHITRLLFLTVGVLLGIALFIFVTPHITNLVHPTKYIASHENLLKVIVPYYVDGEADEKEISIPRGASVRVEESGEKTSTIKYEGELISIDNQYLVDDFEDCLQIETVYPRRLTNLRDKKNGKLTDAVVKKGEEVKVTKINPEDLNTTTGNVEWYQVEKDGKKYWLSGKYVEVSESLATKSYADNVMYSTYWDAYFGEGYSKDAFIDQVDYKPNPKPNYEKNPLSTNINAVHVSLENMINQKDYLKSLNDSTGINAIAVELKGDGGALFYDSDVPKDYLSKPEDAISNTLISQEQLSSLIKEFQDDGFYIIARVVTFKDVIFATQNPSESITDKQNNLILHNDEYWPSAYSRKAWMYNVDIAKEIAQCGVNEIQFDYVRFPDGLSARGDTVDLHNPYNESKTSALQGFLMYAKEELEPYEVYVAADLFAWPVVAQDDQDIGQFLPAIANVVDVISPMPYTDHFSKGAMGIADPTLEPKETMYQFSQIYRKQIDSIHDPGIYRTWIQAYGGFTSDDMIAQIQGINQAGYEGYLVWFGNGDQHSLESNQAGYIDSTLPKQ